MSKEDNDLFEGIQIMTPQELARTVEGEATESAESNALGDEEFVPIVVERNSNNTPVEKTTPEFKTPETNKTESTSERGEVVYKALLKELVKEGVITADEAENIDELPGNFDTIKSLLNKTIDKTVENKQKNWKESLPSAKKRFLEIEDAFDDTDNAIIMAQRLEYFDNLDETTVKGDVTLQKQLYYESLKSKNFTEQEAVEAVMDAEAIGKLEQKSLEALPKLREAANSFVEESRAAKEAKTKEEVESQQKAFQSILDAIEAKDAFIDGLNLNKISREKLKNNIIEPVYTDPKTGREYNSLMYKQMKNPGEFEMLINYYDTLGLFNITDKGNFKPDISKIKTIAKTAAINDLDKIIAAEEQRGVGRNTSVDTSQKTQSVLETLENAFAKRR
jgi:hypothetical protein